MVSDSSSDRAKTFHVVNLGCKVNRVESDDFAAALLARGGEAVDAARADLIVVNTCTVTGEAEKKTRKAVRGALRANDHARVIVTGCAAAISPEVFEGMDPRVQVVPKGSMMGLLAPEGSSFEPHGAAPLLRVGDEFPTRVGIKVQDGCDNACTYCIVHVARGRAWSRPADEIVSEAVRLAQAGVREIVLTGINLGSYSFEGMTLAGLLRRLLDAVEDDVRFRISSVEPRDVHDDLIELMAQADGRICRHLHLPLQSGSPKVLKEMARPYKASYFVELVDRLYEAMPMLSLSTDVIVGFPGETEEDFQETAAMAERCRFSKMHIFRYSMREGTPAARRADQVDPVVKADRAKRLEAIAQALREADRSRRAGTVELALVETNGVATTESYHEVRVAEDAPVGELMEFRL
ncbi:tRNA (N(6)-L-threonylcarbamoyladenosine(37)-C(2))-methylthiotransferase MtaB [Slackia faecicanis]|uniref:tRNA (N(6)-L-threonylcarbamoyladenosine(37)-C(2))-methylthiotransferase MtaB n=1 Tax=Slackia faecicanis TaxID=255723 RepID=A0A3N0AHR5_9ACTN|nr:tRNA (N(6)-L-threonylcarbamoyladenosine(37)-C(2))-methylthiotransferase MtaB [Slackia faecicanis]RNL21370.1 tRNA (N(6)-L-threonylcarbamoyladenosine(37)-C(2))-methylthiotransferase MtaB [Slackia faecicanis]